jgi:hypothetical protein
VVSCFEKTTLAICFKIKYSGKMFYMKLHCFYGQAGIATIVKLMSVGQIARTRGEQKILEGSLTANCEFERQEAGGLRYVGLHENSL